MKYLLAVLLIFSLFTLKSQNGTCLTADPICVGSQVTFPAGTNTGTAEPGPDYGCLLTQPNPAWFYFEIDQGGNLEVEISNSQNEDIDFILWGPFADQTSPCTALLTAGNTVDCSYSTSATETSFIAGANPGEVYIMMITNFSNNNTDITFTPTGPTTATTNCAIVCPNVDFGVFNSGTGNIDPLSATYSCDDAAIVLYADQDGFTGGKAITPGYVVKVFPNNAIATNSIEFFQDGASLGGYGSIGTDSNGNPWVGPVGASTNFSGAMSYVSPSANSPGHQIQLCNNTAGANSTYEVYDLHSGTLLASGTWNGGVGCQTILVSPPPTLTGLATWSTTCGASALPVITDWGAAVFDPSTIPPGTTCDITYSWDAQNGNCAGTSTQTVTITSPYTAGFNYSSTNYCENENSPTPTITGTTGGTFTSYPSGLSLNSSSGQINLNLSSPGSYTVTYTLGSGTCSDSTSQSVVIDSIPNITPLAIIGCDSVSYDGNTYYTSTMVNDTAFGSAANGCDSITNQQIIINNSVTITPTAIVSCDSTTYNGNTYFTTTMVNDTAFGGAANGCDSITNQQIIINNTVINAPNVIIGCDSISYNGNTYFTSILVSDTAFGGAANGCDSITNQMINISNTIVNTPTAIESCDSVSYNGNIYITNTMVSDTAVNGAVNGCDSITNQQIIINSSPIVTFNPFNPDTVCTNSGIITLTNGSPSGGSYSGNGVSGNTFDPAIAGAGLHYIIYNYTDINNCSAQDSSQIFVEVCTGLDSPSSNSLTTKIFPNPTKGIFTLKVNPAFINSRIRIIDVVGAIVFESKIKSEITQISLENRTKGLYFVILDNDDKKSVSKLIME